MKKSILLIVLIAVCFVQCQKEEQLTSKNHITQNKFSSLDLDNPQAVINFLNKEAPEIMAEIDQEGLVKALKADFEENSFERSNGNTVELPAGSMNALQAAVEEAGPNGTVIVKAGEHVENGMVIINHRIRIEGEDGAVLHLDNPVLTDPVPTLNGGLYFSNAPRSVIKNLTIIPSMGEGGVAFFIEESDKLLLYKCHISNYQYSVNINHSDRMYISNNQVHSATGWLSDPSIPGSLGITMINGRYNNIVSNQVTGGQFGIWMCGRGGTSVGNKCSGNFYGQIICKVPAESLMSPTGELIGADEPGHHWFAAFNEDSNNFYAGIVAIDGAYSNLLFVNKGSGNGAYNMELVGDSNRFGFLTPSSYENKVWAASDQVVKDCGMDNQVYGGIQVDIGADPCN